jgi:hypothetical protein
MEGGNGWEQEEGKEMRMEGRDRGRDEVNVRRKEEMLRGREEGETN